jgi:hypothetical protein
MQFDVGRDPIGVSLDTVGQPALRRCFRWNAGEVTNAFNQGARLEAQVRNQLIHELLVRGDGRGLSPCDSPG